MSDIDKIILGALGAITVYLIGQILLKFFVEPVYDLRKEVGKVRFNLAFYATTIHNPTGRSEEMSNNAEKALIKSSSNLIAQIYAVPLFDVTRLLAFGVIPNKKAIEDAAVQLRALTTYLHQTGERATDYLEVIGKRVEKIENLLGLKPLV